MKIKTVKKINNNILTSCVDWHTDIKERVCIIKCIYGSRCSFSIKAGQNHGKDVLFLFKITHCSWISCTVDIHMNKLFSKTKGKKSPQEPTLDVHCRISWTEMPSLALLYEKTLGGTHLRNKCQGKYIINKNFSLTVMLSGELNAPFYFSQITQKSKLNSTHSPVVVLNLCFALC